MNAYYVVALVLVGTLIVTWTLGRLVKRLREPLTLVGNLVARVGTGVVLALVAADVVTHGGLWLVAVPFLVLLALWQFVSTAIVIWVWMREGLDISPNSAP